VDLVIRTRRETYGVGFEDLARDIDAVRSDVSRLFAK
jgi:hypothetical protein